MKDDPIGRQAAIDALRTCYETETITMNNGDEYINYGDAVAEIEQLPSAQTEIIRCKNCRYGVDYYHDGNCYCAKPGYELLYFDGSWEFYCANAERREVTE